MRDPGTILRWRLASSLRARSVSEPARSPHASISKEATMPISSIATAFTRQLRGLRQTRRFTDQPVPDDVVDDILEVARWTGSSKNTQPWHFIVVTDPATRTTLSESGEYAGFLAGAPLVIAVAMKGERPRRESYDEGRVTERIMLAADAHGLGAGTGWFAPGAAGEERVDAALGVPRGMSVIQAIGIGYPAEADQRARSVTGGRKPLEEIASRERFGER
jgi:nitroreductase